MTRVSWAHQALDDDGEVVIVTVHHGARLLRFS